MFLTGLVDKFVENWCEKPTLGSSIKSLAQGVLIKTTLAVKT
jgi:hypothetical protein